MEIRSILFVSLFIILVSLTNCTVNEADFSIRGKIINGAGKTIYFQNFHGNKVNTLDSAKIGENEEFQINFSHPKLDFYQLALSPKNKLILILDSTDNPYIEANADDLFKSFAITGSSHSEVLRQFYKSADTFEQERYALAKAYKSVSNSTDTSKRIRIQDKIFDFNKRYYGYITEFIDSNSTSLAALSAIEKLNIQHDIKYYKKVHESLSSTIPNSIHVKNLNQKIIAAEKNIELVKKQKERRDKLESILAIGKEAPNIELKSPNGELVSLKSLRGKIVLIDFWASWCGPCRKENPNVLKVYNKYHKKGFEIFGVSLDSDLNKWKKAIKDDKLPWYHASDLGGWNSKAALKYGIESIPYTILVDKTGKIIAKNLRGNSLDLKLRELFIG